MSSSEELAAVGDKAAAAVRAARPGSVTVLILEGEPYPDGGATPGARLWQQQKPSALREICARVPVDAMFMDT